MDLACPDGGTKIHQATLQLAATTLSDLVRKFDYTEFQQLLRDDPSQLIPFLNALARISDAQIKCERQLLETAHNEQTAQPAYLAQWLPPVRGGAKPPGEVAPVAGFSRPRDAAAKPSLLITNH